MTQPSLPPLVQQIQYYSRHLALVNNVIMYCSSGESSGYPKTWFPTLGMLRNEKTSIEKVGEFFPIARLPKKYRIWFIKPFEKNLHLTLSENAKATITGSLSKPGDPFLLRMGTLPALLLSSWLGGGVWETAPGKALKKVLKTEYPDFYQQHPDPILLFHKNKDTLNCPDEVNQWLAKRASANSLTELYEKRPTTVPELIAAQQKYSPQFEKARKSLKRTVSELPNKKAMPLKKSLKRTASELPQGETRALKRLKSR